MEMAIVYMCAGMSSRFGGRIKQFAVVGPNGETLIEYSMNQAIKAGFTKIVFIVGNMTEKPFRERFGNSYKKVPVYYSLQKFDEKERDKPWGTADALISASTHLKCPFVICNGDDIYGEKTFEMLINHLKNGENVIPGYVLDSVVPRTGKVNRAVIEIKEGFVKQIREILGIDRIGYKQFGTSLNDLCSMNIFAFQPEIIKLFDEKVKKFKEKHKTDRKGECYLPTETDALVREGKIKLKCYVTKERWIGITNPEDEDTVRRELSGN